MEEYAKYTIEHDTDCEVCQQECDTIYAFITEMKNPDRDIITRICPECMENMRLVLTEYFDHGSI